MSEGVRDAQKNSPPNTTPTNESGAHKRAYVGGGWLLTKNLTDERASLQKTQDPGENGNSIGATTMVTRYVRSIIGTPTLMKSMKR